VIETEHSLRWTTRGDGGMFRGSQINPDKYRARTRMSVTPRRLEEYQVTEQIGFIGLGNMGAAFATRLLMAGEKLQICDIRAQAVAQFAARGAVACASPRAVAAAAEVVFMSLPTPAVVEQVALDVAGAAGNRRLRCLIDLSTTGPVMASSLAEKLAEAGIVYVDAPVSGGVAGAVAGTVVIMLACGDEIARTLTPLLSLLGQVFHVGKRAGQGQVTKLLNNMLSAGALLLSGEVTALGAKAGVDADTMIAVFNAGSGRNSATLDKYPKAILPGTFNLGFTNALMLKDLELCLQMAHDMGVAMPLGVEIGREWRAATDVTGAEADFTTIVRRSEIRAGVEVRSKPAQPKT
jgi:3-hydroxyisobutyrate dehydrogenase-like beta-hydroxyacid dehydrogenase